MSRRNAKLNNAAKALPALEAALSSAAAKEERKGKKKHHKSSLSKVLHTGGQIASIAGSLAPLLEFAPLLLARHPVIGPQMKAAGMAPEMLPVSAPAATSLNTMSSFKVKQVNEKLRITTTNVIAQVSIPSSGLLAGGVLTAIPLDIASSSFRGTPIHYFAQVAARWKLLSCSVIYVPTCPTTAAGSLVIGMTPDPDRVISAAGFAAVQEAASSEGAVQVPVWQPESASYPASAPRVSLFNSAFNGAEDPLVLGVESRQCSAGQIFVVAGNDLDGFTDGITTQYTYGQLMVTGEFELSAPTVVDQQLINFWNGTNTGTASLSTAFPMGPQSGPDGLNSWTATWPELPPANLPLRMDTSGSSARLYGLPTGYYLVYSVINGSGTWTPVAPGGLAQLDVGNWFGSYSVLQHYDYPGGTATNNQFTCMLLLEVASATNDPDDGWFTPYNILTPTTAFAVDTVHVTVHRVAAYGYDVPAPMAHGQSKHRQDRRLAILRALGFAEPLKRQRYVTNSKGLVFTECGDLKPAAGEVVEHSSTYCPLSECGCGYFHKMPKGCLTFDPCPNDSMHPPISTESSPDLRTCVACGVRGSSHPKP